MLEQGVVRLVKFWRVDRGDQSVSGNRASIYPSCGVSCPIFPRLIRSHINTRSTSLSSLEAKQINRADRPSRSCCLSSAGSRTRPYALMPSLARPPQRFLPAASGEALSTLYVRR